MSFVCALPLLAESGPVIVCVDARGRLDSYVCRTDTQIAEVTCGHNSCSKASWSTNEMPANELLRVIPFGETLGYPKTADGRYRVRMEIDRLQKENPVNEVRIRQLSEVHATITRFALFQSALLSSQVKFLSTHDSYQGVSFESFKHAVESYAAPSSPPSQTQPNPSNDFERRDKCIESCRDQNAERYQVCAANPYSVNIGACYTDSMDAYERCIKVCWGSR